MLKSNKNCNKSLDCIYIDSIMSSQVVEESYYDVNKEMDKDRYKGLFEGVVLHFKENFVDRPRRQKERMDADY